MRKVVIIAGSNRTGTSLLTEIMIHKGFSPPADVHEDNKEYATYESREFKEISRHWNIRRARRFVDRLAGDRIVLKYPKASYVLHRWLKLIPDARVIYVYRPREQAVASQIEHWWKPRPAAWLGRWIYRVEWTRGFLAMSNLPVPVCFVTFDELKCTGDLIFPKSFGWDE